MPFVRYFLVTGAILLGLLFLAERNLPRPTDKVATDIDRSVIRIHTSQRWPAAVRIDTSAPMPRVAPVAVAVESEAPLPATIREAKAYLPTVSAKPFDKPRRREKRIARSTARPAEPRLAYQSNWLSADW